jgi:hypothetical protein
MVYKKNQVYRDLSKKLTGKATLAMSLLTNGDESDMIRGTKLWEEITDELWASRLSNELKITLQNSLVNVGGIIDVMKNAHRLDLGYEAGVLSQQTQ